jgi:hypothetical protein
MRAKCLRASATTLDSTIEFGKKKWNAWPNVPADGRPPDHQNISDVPSFHFGH